MKSLLAFLIAISYFQTVLAEQTTNSDDEIILPASLPQKIVSRYETNFSRHHDRDFYLSATLGPQWVHSVKAPEAKEIRFGGNLIVGIVIFLLLMLINMLVIAKGSERVAEVAARFTLDAMPGKQMSIDGLC